MGFSLINIYKKLRLKIILLFSFLVFFVGLMGLYYVTAVTPMSNDECIWKPVNAAGKPVLMFERVKPGGVTWNAGIRNGDFLIAINDKPVTIDKEAQIILNKLKAGSYATYTIKRENVTCNVSIYIKKLIDFGDLGFALLSFIWFIIGFIVITAKPDGDVQRLFYKTGASFILARSVAILSYQVTYNFNPQYLVFYKIFGMMTFGIACFMPFYFLKFFMVFPRKIKIVNYKRFDLIFYSLPALLFLVEVFLQRTNPNINFLIFLIQKLFYTSALLSFLFLLYNYFRIKNREERKPVFIIIIGYALGISALLYTSLIAPQIADTFYNTPEYFMPIIIVILLPIAFGYSIFKYQLMDVSVVIKNGIIYGAATVTLAGIYFGLIYVLGQSVSMVISPEYQSLIAGLVFIFFSMAFQSTKDKVQDLITKQFYPEQFAYQRMLIKFSNEVSGVVGLEKILSSMQNTFVDSLRLKKFAALLKNESNGMFELKRCHGLENCVISINSRNSNIESYLKKKSISINNVIIEQSDFGYVFPEENALLIEQQIFTIVPLVIKSKVIGLLLFGLKYSGSQFAGKDVELLCSAANQSAIAIENARLYDLENQKLKIEIDLDYARKIQRGLLPHCIPDFDELDICGEMIPAMQVGGDYYDLIKVSPDKLFVIVGDVSGKGLSASLYMAKLQTMLQLTCNATSSPKELLVELNRRLFEALEKNWFITMSVALFDLNARKVRFCRAGHVPIIKIGKSESEIFQPKGIGVGLEKGRIFEKSLAEIEIKLEQGDIWAFVSDGVTEAMDERQNLFGMQNLINTLEKYRALPTPLIMGSLVDELGEYRGKAEQNDDITGVIVKVK
jgi:serine phosphatase RsbU (regulator of sigma subunit)